MLRTVLASVGLAALLACGGGGGGGLPDGGADGGSTDWTVEALYDTPVLTPGDDGCLVASSAVVPRGERRTVLAASDDLVLVAPERGLVFAADVEEQSRPETLPAPENTGVLRLPVFRHTFDAALCPSPGDELPEDTPVEAHARWYDANYRGFVVIDRELGLASVRAVDVEAWVYPWHTTVQMVKPLGEGQGYVVGGAVVVGPNLLLTAEHNQVDETWCYSRHPNSGVAWAGGLFECANIAGPAEVHPDQVDVALVRLVEPEPEPYAPLRLRPMEIGDAFYTANTRTFHLHYLTDSTVAEVSSRNAGCESWPDETTFSGPGLIVDGGDSGGPAFVGDELAGIVHGHGCRTGLETPQSVFIHVPALLPWLEPELGP